MEQSLQAMSGQVQLEQWSRKITACRGSGMTVRAWCQENGISEKTYYCWQRRLFQELTNAQPQSSGFVEVTPRETESSEQLAVRIRIADAEAEIYNDTDAATLEAVLRALPSRRTISPERSRCISPVATRIFGRGSTDWLH